MSRSEFIRNAALGITPRSQLDRKNIADLAKLNADMGRLGGLLKLWLMRLEDNELHKGLQIHDLLRDIHQLKDKIKTAIDKL